MTPNEKVEHLTQEVARCEQELAKLEATERDALAASSLATSEFKMQRNAAAAKRLTTAKNDAEFAGLAREGASEELASVREALVIAEHEAKVAQIAPQEQETSIESFLSVLRPKLTEISQLRAKIQMAGQTIKEHARDFSKARSDVCVRAFTLGVPIDAINYFTVAGQVENGEPVADATFPVDCDRFLDFMVTALVERPTQRDPARAKLNVYRDACDRFGHFAAEVDRRAATRAPDEPPGKDELACAKQREEVRAELSALRSELTTLGLGGAVNVIDACQTNHS